MVCNRQEWRKFLVPYCNMEQITSTKGLLHTMCWKSPDTMKKQHGRANFIMAAWV